jgi:LPXTG-motif cell wall-anchored protein
MSEYWLIVLGAAFLCTVAGWAIRRRRRAARRKARNPGDIYPVW